MSSIIISGIMVVLAASGMLFGMFLRSRLPEHHLSPDVKDISKVALGLVATISALVLSLLLSMAKTSFVGLSVGEVAIVSYSTGAWPVVKTMPGL